MQKCWTFNFDLDLFLSSLGDVQSHSISAEDYESEKADKNTLRDNQRMSDRYHSDIPVVLSRSRWDFSIQVIRNVDC